MVALTSTAVYNNILDLTAVNNGICLTSPAVNNGMLDLAAVNNGMLKSHIEFMHEDPLFKTHEDVVEEFPSTSCE